MYNYKKLKNKFLKKLHNFNILISKSWKMQLVCNPEAIVFRVFLRLAILWSLKWYYVVICIFSIINDVKCVLCAVTILMFNCLSGCFSLSLTSNLLLLVVFYFSSFNHWVIILYISPHAHISNISPISCL